MSCMEGLLSQAWELYSSQSRELRLSGTLLEDLWHKIAQLEAPSPEDEHARLDICADLAERVSSLGATMGGALSAEAHGSFVMGCYSSASALEVAVTGRLPAAAPTRGTLVDVELRGATERLALLERVHTLIADSGMAAQGTVAIHRGARVPSVSFEHAGSGIPVRVCIAYPGFALRGHVVRGLAGLEPRLRSLLQLVELWAEARGLNNPAAGTFNSWALMNLAIFALQTFQPHPLLPPLWRVCGPAEPAPGAGAGAAASSSGGAAAPAPATGLGGSGGGAPAAAARPLQRLPLATSSEALQPVLREVEARLSGPPEALGLPAAGPSAPGLLPLFHWFLLLLDRLLAAWQLSWNRRWRVSTWAGALVQQPFNRAFLVPVECPFDPADNAAKSLGCENQPRHQEVFRSVVAEVGASLRLLLATKAPQDLDRAVLGLFGLEVEHLYLEEEEEAEPEVQEPHANAPADAEQEQLLEQGHGQAGVPAQQHQQPEQCAHSPDAEGEPPPESLSPPQPLQVQEEAPAKQRGGEVDDARGAEGPGFEQHGRSAAQPGLSLEEEAVLVVADVGVERNMGDGGGHSASRPASQARPSPAAATGAGPAAPPAATAATAAAAASPAAAVASAAVEAEAAAAGSASGSQAEGPSALRANATVQRPLAPLLRDVTNGRRRGGSPGLEPKVIGASGTPAFATSTAAPAPTPEPDAFASFFGTLVEGARRLFDNVAQGVAELGEDLNELAVNTVHTIRAVINDDEDLPFFSTALRERQRRTQRLQLLHRQPGSGAAGSPAGSAGKAARTPGTPRSVAPSPGMSPQPPRRQPRGRSTPAGPGSSGAAGAPGKPPSAAPSPAKPKAAVVAAAAAAPRAGAAPMQRAAPHALSSPPPQPPLPSDQQRKQRKQCVEAAVAGAAGASAAASVQPHAPIVEAAAVSSGSGGKGPSKEDTLREASAPGRSSSALATAPTGTLDSGVKHTDQQQGADAVSTSAQGRPSAAGASADRQVDPLGDLPVISVSLHGAAGDSATRTATCAVSTAGEADERPATAAAVGPVDPAAPSAPTSAAAEGGAREGSYAASQEQGPPPAATDASSCPPANTEPERAGAGVPSAPTPGVLGAAALGVDPACGASACGTLSLSCASVSAPSTTSASTPSSPTSLSTARSTGLAPSQRHASAACGGGGSSSLGPTASASVTAAAGTSTSAALQRPGAPPPLPPPPPPPVGVGGLRVKSAVFRKGAAREALTLSVSTPASTPAPDSITLAPSAAPASSAIAASPSSFRLRGTASFPSPSASTASTGAAAAAAGNATAVGASSSAPSGPSAPPLPPRTTIALSSGRLQEVAECIDRAGPATTLDLQGHTFTGTLAAPVMKVSAAGLWLVNGCLVLQPEQQLLVVAKGAQLRDMTLRDAAAATSLTAAPATAASTAATPQQQQVSGGGATAPQSAAAAATGRPAVLVTKQSYAGGGELMLSGCTLHLGPGRGVGLQVKGKGCVLAAEGCSVAGSAAAAVQASDAAVSLVGCTLSGGAGHGLLCRDNATAVVADCLLAGFGGAAAAVQAGGSLELTGCTLRGGAAVAERVHGDDAPCESGRNGAADNGAGGVSQGRASSGSGGGVATGSALAPGGGVLADGKGSAVVARGSVLDGFRSQAALVVTAGAAASLEDCKATDCQLGALVGTRGGRLLASRCELSRHAAGGLVVGEGATADLRECRLEGNGGPGLRVAGVGSMAVLRTCEASRNRGAGVAVGAGGCANLHGCSACENNASIDGVAGAAGAASKGGASGSGATGAGTVGVGEEPPSVRSGCGLMVDGAGARATASRCSFLRNAGPGVAAGGHGSAQLTGCRMEGNGRGRCDEAGGGGGGGACGANGPRAGEGTGLQLEVGPHGRVVVSGGCSWHAEAHEEKGQGEEGSGEAGRGTGSGHGRGLRVAALGTLEVLE